MSESDAELRLRPGLAERWASALESGEFVQGIGCLATVVAGTDQVNHCCLGVLCELARADGVVERVTAPNFRDRYAYRAVDAPPEDEGAAFTLPPVVARWAGLLPDDVTDDLDQNDVRLNPPVDGTPLSVWNDGESLWFGDEPLTSVEARDFAGIARLIREYL